MTRPKKKKNGAESSRSYGVKHFFRSISRRTCRKNMNFYLYNCNKLCMRRQFCNVSVENKQQKQQQQHKLQKQLQQQGGHVETRS